MPNPHFRVSVAGATDKGRVRSHNEDAFLLVDLDSEQRVESRAEWQVGDRGLLLAVSDGMGGAAAGEVASAVSLDALHRELTHENGEGGVPDRLRRVVLAANKRVREEARRPDRRGMGATLTAALFCGTVVHLAQIGDSRAYLIRGNEIRQVTHDQSYVQMLVDEGVLTPEEAERSPQKNVLLQALGQAGPLRVGLGHITVAPGDRLLLCSDGLTNAISDTQIAELARGDVDAACGALIDAANRAGGPDNITVILASVC
jgi:PPM family protein phosphatase